MIIGQMILGGTVVRGATLTLALGLAGAACGNGTGGGHGDAGASGAAFAPAGNAGTAASGSGAGGSSYEAGSSGSAGSSLAGSNAAGSNNGGTGPSGGSGGSASSSGGAPVVGEHCLGADVLVFPDEVFSDFGGPMSNCLTYVPGAPGITPGDELSVRDIELATPLTANQPYAFSIKVTNAPVNQPNTIELWSADDKCGAAQEKLYEGIMKVGVLCVELQPTASHTRLLMAWKGSGTRGTTDVGICPSGSCPN